MTQLSAVPLLLDLHRLSSSPSLIPLVLFCNQVWPLSEAKLFGTEPELCGSCIHRPGAGGPNVAMGDVATTAAAATTTTTTTTRESAETEIRGGASSEDEAV